MLPVAPERLDRIEFRSAGKVFDRDQAFEGIEELSHPLAAMCGQPIPHHQQRTLQALQQRSRERELFLPSDRLVEI
jgi:hypothetical protein